MAVRLVYCASYLTEPGEWRQDDFATGKFIKAIKGNRDFTGFAKVPVRGNRLRLDMNNRPLAYTWFGQMAGDYFRQQVSLPQGTTLRVVPLPSSDAVLGTAFTRFPARDLANAFCRVAGPSFVMTDVLRWRVAKESASTGSGSRNASVLRENLVVAPAAPPGDYMVLDDVCTSGAHLRAAIARLEEQPGVTVSYALCAGRTCREPADDPWAIQNEAFDASIPDLSWMFS
ncbi:hypothetical protein JKA73_10950 [Myxococcus xanthus]|uniref:hypothetical protein n=1 Tax=Myxococcus xanthus TaxID=34 RepID=UPI0019176C7B|nr:hypothetical protein [Myxococcus xanthus]QQR46546.1 hypothetical protein JKA73_10950 [Myxococcus xanthus]